MNSVQIENHLKYFLSKNLPLHNSSRIYDYALFPSGKLVRSLYFFALINDLKGQANDECFIYTNFLETHHAYSLVHDDLPCMDNDDYRRGKLSTHKAFGEWQALLIGDGLLISSFAALSRTQNKNLQFLLKLASFATGPKGLIHGQYLDLNKEMNLDLKHLLKTHELKTARLFQLASVFAYLHSSNTVSFKQIWKFWKKGKYLGIVFQLLDDLQELCEEKINSEELKKNPFLIHKDTMSILNNYLIYLKDAFSELEHTRNYLNDVYFKKVQDTINKNADNLKKFNIGIKELKLCL